MLEPVTIYGANKIFITFKTRNISNNDFYIANGFSLNWNICSEKCLSCPAGTVYDFLKKECVDCPDFTHSTSGSLKCEMCPPGTKWESITECAPCKPGYYGIFGDCVACPKGQVALQFKTIECSNCSNTSYAVNGTKCVECKKGEKANMEGTGCEPIPIPPVPHNMQTIILYSILTGALLLIVVAVLTYLQWKKSRGSQGYDYSQIQMM